MKTKKTPNIGVLLVLLFMCTLHPTPAQRSYGGIARILSVQSAQKQATPGYWIEMPAFDIDSAQYVQQTHLGRAGSNTFAHPFFCNIHPGNAGIQYTDNTSEKHVWEVGIRSNGAYSLSLFFDRFDLPEGAGLIVFNNDKSQVLGTFTNQNRAPNNTCILSPIAGDEIIVQYQQPEAFTESPPLRISEVYHDYRGIFRSGTRFNQLNLPCLPEVSCNPELAGIRRSVCLLIVGGTEYCTGVLVNNSNGDGRPYLLTAAHCLKNNPANASRTLAYFNYLAPHCKADIRGSEEFSITGFTTRALSNAYDFALLELDQSIPADYQTYLSGWNIDTQANQTGPFTSIHHPFGEPMKYAVETDSLRPSNWPGYADGIADSVHWNVYRWETGHTWAGSSGSPLFNANNQLVGILTGGDSGGQNGCSTYETGDFFVRLDRAWENHADSSKQLKYWLDPKSRSSKPLETVQLNGLQALSKDSAFRQSNLQQQDSLQEFYLINPGKGPLLGQNNTGIQQYVERFDLQDSCLLLGAYYLIAKGSPNSTYPTQICVYDGKPSEEGPNRLIHKQALSTHYWDYSNNQFIQKQKTDFNQRATYIRLDSAVSVGHTFYMGYELSYELETSNDTFFVYTSQHTDSQRNTSWFKYGLDWLPFNKHILQEKALTMGIEPVLMRDSLPHNNGSDPDSIPPTQRRPIVAYQSITSTLAIQFPDTWDLPCQVSLIDLMGRTLLHFEATEQKSYQTIHLQPRTLFLIRMSSKHVKACEKIYYRP